MTKERIATLRRIADIDGPRSYLGEALDALEAAQHEIVELQAACRGRTVSCVCGGEAQRDSERLDWWIRQPAYITYSTDGDDCWLHYAYNPTDEESAPYNLPNAQNPRAAIDDAMAKEKENSQC